MSKTKAAKTPAQISAETAERERKRRAAEAKAAKAKAERKRAKERAVVKAEAKKLAPKLYKAYRKEIDARSARNERRLEHNVYCPYAVTCGRHLSEDIWDETRRLVYEKLEKGGYTVTRRYRETAVDQAQDVLFTTYETTSWVEITW